MAGFLGACREKEPMLGQLDPVIDVKALTAQLQALADGAAPGALGVAVRDAQTGQTVAFNADRRFPLQGVFRAPLGAAVLAEVDAGKLRLEQIITIRDIDLSPPFSPVADAWPARTDYSLVELLERATGAGDNTAADVLMKLIGGPGVLTAWLVLKNVHDFRIDRYERQLQPEIAGTASFRADWKGEAAYGPVRRATPQAVRRQAMAEYLAEARDTATPVAAVGFLEALRSGQLISKASTQRLLTILAEAQSGKGRLVAALPAGARLAHVTGDARTDLGMTPATNDIGIITLKDGRQFAIAVFLSGSTAPEAERDAVIARAGRIVLEALKA
ncbi:MAG: class A beta-lactamase [Alphaproteobacteria bacterium]|nr:class A beta-lactamase [Alphaproteobacteria bacterium]